MKNIKEVQRIGQAKKTSTMFLVVNGRNIDFEGQEL